MPESSQTLVYVVTHGDTPAAAAATLDTALDAAMARQTAWAIASDYDYRWDEYAPGSVFRLMQRRKDVAGKGRRFSWTSYAVHAVEFLGGAA